MNKTNKVLINTKCIERNLVEITRLITRRLPLNMHIIKPHSFQKHLELKYLPVIGEMSYKFNLPPFVLLP